MSTLCNWGDTHKHSKYTLFSFGIYHSCFLKFIPSMYEQIQPNVHTEESGYSLPRKQSTATVPKLTHTLTNVTLNVSNLYSTFWADLSTGSKVKERIWVQHNFTYIVLVGTNIRLGKLFCVFSTE